MLSRYFDLWTASSIVPVANSQGQYTIQYTPTDNGIFLLRVSLLLPEQAHDNYGLSEVIETMKTVKSELYQSPYVVTVSDGSVSSLTSHAYGVGLSHTTAGVDAYFTVQARDQAGNNRTFVLEKQIKPDATVHTSSPHLHGSVLAIEPLVTVHGGPEQ